MSEEANLGSKNKKPLIVLPLYSSLSSKQQLKCFQKSAMNTRKVIVCTNMAETSVTIPGIVYVIDALYAKINIFDPDLSLNCLTSVPISKASAEQRKGRAGRMSPGKCFRLCTENDFALLQKENVPEIQRTKMTEPILQLKALGIDNIANFEFFSPPPSKIVIESINQLYELGIIDDQNNLTKIGEICTEMPLDPRTSKSIIWASKNGCSEELISIAAMLSVKDVFLRPFI
ncbi:hypothetical protein MHBO_002743 [Bonamia ostreae]|uniref:Helicase C-terminal domain-containing protein n=1 Tax=Bonamia ostreae TaxID=126728 RepID=A0ABV2ANT3_9EUKA